ncbi:glycoside hydrolase family 13 protein [Acholeplasma equirhinis]|uniref:glycoside hydrolase family 13 protein n=1 Tax=Acholeplasma equirhinis TaxID=555393 RepID=UPI00197AF91E|nr:glycoside hydrolase family 13 protein [Acholeplasma equirhinis]MBN3490120.1 glycoside hydrolase family 13 protein [Acholeplasma equirhinis]
MSENKFDIREKDWRNGALVYQVLVDRFYSSKTIEEKRNLYPYPKNLKPWGELPKGGTFLEDVRYWSHELDFWGGDLKGVTEKIDYIKNLGMDVLYLNPICESLSNHKYDATDYLEISKEFGTKEDLQQLISNIHSNNMKIMLDGVFNHVGINNPLFQKALKNEGFRDFFDFNQKYPRGVRLWADAPSLPELNLENDSVKDYIYRSNDSVIRSYIKQGVDGWRLDVAFDIGFNILKDLRDHARLDKEDTMIVGEIWNYPEKWLKSIDGVMNFTFREITLRLLRGEISAKKALKMITDTINDAGIEPILKSWNLLDNHDVPRLKNLLETEKLQQLAQVLQFTLPGSPNLYYGTELGMDGGFDPANRAPMRWDLVSEENKTLAWTKSLIKLHKDNRALKIGDFIPIDSDQLISFMRLTNNVKDTCIVVVNPTNQQVKETVLLKDSKLMNFSGFNYVFGKIEPVTLLAGLMEFNIEPYGFVVIKPKTEPEKSYTPYKRV